MNNNFKKIHIGELIKKKVSELEIEMDRICKFLSAGENVIEKMFQSYSIDTELLLRWSKLLEYDFFRIYTQHLILYAPPSAYDQVNSKEKKESCLPEFRKNIYTTEIIYFILELIETGAKTKQEVIDEYRIPKTTLYKWISKYQERT